MEHLPLKLAVRYQTAKQAMDDRAETLVHDERGELGSWMILAAGLAAAAATAVIALTAWFVTKTGEITKN